MDLTSININKLTPDVFCNEKDIYLQHFGTYKNWNDIPLLNHGSIYYPDKSLVRFRGMIQDMYNPEIYLETYETVDAEGGTKLCNGKYKDVNTCAVCIYIYIIIIFLY